MLAPGELTTSSIGGGFKDVNGTSFATPVVVGSFAILKKAYPTATIDQMVQSLIDTGRIIFDNRSGANGLGYSRVQIDVALVRLRQLIEGNGPTCATNATSGISNQMDCSSGGSH